MLSKESIEIVKGSVPLLKESGVDITKTFYKNMFTNNPEVKQFFDMDKQASGEQPKALANAILAAAQNIDNLPAILPAVEKIAKRHCALGIKEEHYPIVGKNLLLTLKEMLGEGATPEVMKAWEEAYGEIAAVFIQVEKEIYKNA